MPERAIVSKELANLLGVLSHPARIRIAEELRDGERDVQSLQQVLGIGQAGVSQHLSVLRAHRVVVERREGRHVYYHLRMPELATWLAEGLKFLEVQRADYEQLQSAVERVRTLWGDAPSVEAPSRGSGR